MKSVLSLLIGEDVGPLVGWSSESAMGESESTVCERASSWALSFRAMNVAVRCAVYGRETLIKT